LACCQITLRKPLNSKFVLLSLVIPTNKKMTPRCDLPEHEVDLVVNGCMYWRDVGFRMAFDRWQTLTQKGHDALIYPSWYSETANLPSYWLQKPTNHRNRAD
jgi:hypothetical protein